MAPADTAVVEGTMVQGTYVQGAASSTTPVGQAHVPYRRGRTAEALPIVDAEEGNARFLSKVSYDAATRAKHLETKRLIERQLRSYEKGIVNPRTSKWVPWWDTATFVCLMFTAIITPFEVCLIQKPSAIWGIVNWIVNAFFIMDMILQFFLAYQESPKKGGRWIMHRPAIVRHYVRTWFFLDLFSSIDFQLVGGAIAKAYASDESADGEDSTNLLRLIRGIRLVRLVKLLRILRASRIIARWQNFIGLSFAQLSMVKFATMTVFLVHILACFWAYWGINWKKADTDLEHETTWIVAGGFEPWVDDRPVRIYTVAFYVAVVAMFGGVGSVVPHNYYEYMALTIMMVFGSFVWAWVIGSLCGILATLNPHATAFRNTMDELNYFMHESGFTTTHRVRLREFFRQTEDFERVVAYDELLQKMSAQLRGDTALLMGEDVLRNVWYLSAENVETEFLSVIALHMHHAVYESRELIPVHDLTVITKGMTAIRLQIRTKGGVFGEDCIIEDRHAGLRDMVKVNCLTFVQVIFIARHEIFELVENFPAAKSWLNHCAKILTLRAGLKKYYAAYKRELRRRRAEASSGAELGARMKAIPTRAIAMMARTGTGLEEKKLAVYGEEVVSVQSFDDDSRQSAATIFADLMHQKKMEQLLGSVQDKTEESAENKMRRSMNHLERNIDDSRTAQIDQGARLDQLSRQQQQLDQKLEIQLSLITQLIAAGEKRERREERREPSPSRGSAARLGTSPGGRSGRLELGGRSGRLEHSPGRPEHVHKDKKVVTTRRVRKNLGKMEDKVDTAMAARRLSVSGSGRSLLADPAPTASDGSPKSDLEA